MADSAWKQQQFISLIVWGSLIGSLFIYLVLVLAVFHGRAPAVEVDGQSVGAMVLLFALMSAAQVGALFYLRPTLFFHKFEEGRFSSMNELTGGYFTMSIVTWALSEAVAIYGFTLSVLSSNAIYYVAFMVPSLGLFLLFRPNLTSLGERYLDEFGASLESEGTSSAPDEGSDEVW